MKGKKKRKFMMISVRLQAKKQEKRETEIESEESLKKISIRFRAPLALPES